MEMLSPRNHEVFSLRHELFGKNLTLRSTEAVPHSLEENYDFAIYLFGEKNICFGVSEGTI